MVAERLGVTERMITRLMRRGVLPYYKISRKCVRFDVQEVEAAIRRLAGGAREGG